MRTLLFLAALGLPVAAIGAAKADGYGDLLLCAELKEPLMDTAVLCTQALNSGQLNERQVAQALMFRGVIAYRLGAHEDAIDDFSLSVQYDPELADAYYFKGLAFEALGEQTRADGQYKNAYFYDPNDTEIAAKMRERALLN